MASSSSRKTLSDPAAVFPQESSDRLLAWQVALRPGRRRKLEPDSPEARAERTKAPVRAKVEHPFLKVKGLFGYAKVRYRGLAKNTERLALLLGLTNLTIAPRYPATSPRG